MSDFQVKSDNVDVEQIMRQIRTRIREKRGVDYTEDEIRELANVKLEKFLDPKGVRSDLLQQYRQAREATLPPNFAFEDTTLFETHRGLLAFIRRLLRPILKLFFNPNPLIEALHIQSKLNEARAAVEPLHFEIIHNLVLELTRTSIEVKSLKMRLESMASRLDFDERRARALEGVVQYRPGAVPPLQPPVSQDQGRRDHGRRDARPGRDQRDQGPRDRGDRGQRDFRPRDQGPRDQGSRDQGPRDQGPRDQGPPREQLPRDPAATETAVQPARTDGLESNALDNEGNERRARRRRRRGRRRAGAAGGVETAAAANGAPAAATDRDNELDEGGDGSASAAEETTGGFAQTRPAPDGEDRGFDPQRAVSHIDRQRSAVDYRTDTPDSTSPAESRPTGSEPQQSESVAPKPRESEAERGEGGPVAPKPREGEAGRESEAERGEGGPVAPKPRGSEAERGEGG